MITVLLVEDSPAEAQLLQSQLQEDTGEKYRVFHAKRLMEAYATVNATELIDVVLLDLGLPDSRGLDTLHRMTEAHPNLPVVVVTSQRELGEDAIRFGAQDFWVKSEVTGAILGHSIRYAMERHRLRRELEASEARARESAEKLSELNARLNALATHDPLTQQLNVRGLELALEHEYDRGTPTTALMIRVENGGDILARHGKRGRNMLMMEISEHVAASARAGDHVGVVGSDFVILQPDFHLGAALLMADAIVSTLRRGPLIIDGERIELTPVSGVAEAPRRASSLEEVCNLLRLSMRKRALAESEKGGVAALAAARESEIITKLCDESSYHAVGQAIMTLENERVVGREMLSRTEIEGYEMPADFFPAGLQADVLARVDLCCLKTCIDAADGGDSMRIHVNVFPSTLVSTPLDTLTDLFPDIRDAGDYCIEISQQEFVGDLDGLRSRLEELREAGFLIALNEVGYGRRSLERLVLLSPDVVKLDPRLFLAVRRDPEQLAPLRRLVQMIDSLNAVIIAAGLETDDDLQVARDLGIDFGQGFRWSEL